jgi:hypothetical protein
VVWTKERKEGTHLILEPMPAPADEPVVEGTVELVVVVPVGLVLVYEDMIVVYQKYPVTPPPYNCLYVKRIWRGEEK